MADLRQEPGRAQTEESWRNLLGVTAICDMRPGTLQSMANGSPDYDPTRYSPAEVRLARAVITLAGALIVERPDLFGRRLTPQKEEELAR